MPYPVYHCPLWNCKRIQYNHIFKQLKVGLNFYSPKPHVQTQNSIRKRQFSRKPAQNIPSFSSQNKRKGAVAIEKIQTAKSIDQTPAKDRIFTQAPSNVAQLMRKQRQTENFYKDKELVNQFTRKYEKDLLYSSKSQKNLQIRQNNFNKKQLGQVYYNRQFKPTTETSKFYDRAKQDLQNQGLIDQSENESVQSFKENKSISNTSEKVVSFKRFLSSNNFACYKNQIEDKVQTQECFYCKNNKLIVSILTEKQRKLQNQYIAKIGAVKEFMQKCDLLKEENRILINKIDQNVEIFKTKESYFYREKEELIGRIQILKKDFSKLNQRLKYEQIQNSILLRYKDQYQLITQQFDSLRHDNTILKRQLVAYQNQNQNRFNFSKGKKKADNEKKYEFYNKLISPSNQKRKYHRQDDQVSLNFSQQSFQIV